MFFHQSICWHTVTQDKGDLATEQTGERENKAEKDLSLNKLPAFQENGCLDCTVEAVDGSWPRLGPSVPQNGVMPAGTWPLLPYGRHVQWEGN